MNINWKKIGRVVLKVAKPIAVGIVAREVAKVPIVRDVIGAIVSKAPLE